MSYVLFAVHGMGVFKKDAWVDDLKTLLDSLTAPYKAFQKKSFTSQVSVVPISYDGAFSATLDRWAKQSGALKAAAAQVPDSASLADLTNWLENSNEPNFFWDHAVDVLLYRFFPDVANEVRIQCEYQIADLLTAAQAESTPDNPVFASVMAHSLGTAVIHDVLARLASEPITENGVTSNAWLAANGVRFRNLFMVANTSHLLRSQWDPYTSSIHPNSQKSAAAPPYVQHYWNYRHVLDPVAAFCAFDPPTPWGNRLHRMEDIDHIAQFNVHDWGHYLSNPRVHTEIINALFEDVVITPDEERVATAKYLEQSVPVCASTLSSVVSDLTTAVAGLDSVCDPVALIKHIPSFLARVAKASADCV